MRRFIVTTFAILMLVISAAGAAPAAHAADCTNSSAVGDSCTTNGGAAGTCQVDESASSATGMMCISTADTAAASAAATQAAAQQAVDMQPTPKLDGVMAQIMSFIMSLFAWLLGVSMIVLNYAVYYTVVTMGDYVHNLTAVGVAWRILRDIGNIMLIFGFLAVGITTILNVDWYGGGKKMLPMMLVAAVFLNFSLFISEAIIDTGNLFATQFYTQIVGGTLPTSDDMSKMTIKGEGVSNKIMDQLGLAKIYSGALSNKDVLPDGTSVFIGFMSIILFLIAAFVMFSLAFVLIARFVYLIFLIILAPVGFAGLAVPMLAKRAGQWWSKLFEQTVTAPVLLLMLYIALAIITDANFLGFGPRGNGDWLGFVTKNGSTNFAGFGSILLSFLIAMGLLLLVVIQAKNLGAVGAATMMKFGQNAAMGSVKFAGRSALGVGRWGVNRTAGRAAHMASQGLMRTGFGQTQFGRLAATGLGKAGKGFKDAKDKSAKTHEEYRNSVAKALEEKHAPAIANAQLKRANAEEAVKPKLEAENAAKETKGKAEKEAKPLIDEVKRLEEIIKSKGKFDPERITAEKNLPTAKASVEAKTNAAEVAFNAAHEETEKAKKESGLDEAMKEEAAATKILADAKRDAAVAYGENARTAITQNPLSWVVSGPGGSVAGNKIIQDTLKKMSDTNKAIDMLKKAFEQETKTANKSAETSEKLNIAKEDLKGKTEEEAEPAKP